MQEDGIQIFVSKNRVGLTGQITPQYLAVLGGG